MTSFVRLLHHWWRAVNVDSDVLLLTCWMMKVELMVAVDVVAGCVAVVSQKNKKKVWILVAVVAITAISLRLKQHGGY